MLTPRGTGVTVASPVQKNFLDPIQSILAGGGVSAGGARMGGSQPSLEDRYAKLSALLGDPTWKPGQDELGLRSLAYKQTESAYGDNTDFLDTAYGRLVQAQTAESTNAGIRDYLARTGGAGTAAAAATAASLRARGGTDLARAGLAAKDQQQSRVGQLLDFLQGSLNREARGSEVGYGAKAGLLGQLVGQENALALAREQQKTAAIGALGGWASSFGSGMASAQMQARALNNQEAAYRDARRDKWAEEAASGTEQWLTRYGDVGSREMGGGGKVGSILGESVRRQSASELRDQLKRLLG